MKQRILAVLALATMIPALYLIFIYAPIEVTQGNVQRIFYFHVPLATAGYVSAGLMFIGSLMYLIKRDLKWDRFAAAAGEMGVLFLTAQLWTAIHWAKPIWGIWFAFDSRGTLQLVLYLIFISSVMLRAYLPEREKQAKLGAVFGILAMLDVPFNYLSIYLFRTQHPQPVVSPGGGGLDPQMWPAFIAGFITLSFVYAYLFVRRIELAKVEEEVDYLSHLAFSHDV
jgi:heme exporter protein C